MTCEITALSYCDSLKTVRAYLHPLHRKRRERRRGRGDRSRRAGLAIQRNHSDSDALTWHYLPSLRQAASQLVLASTTFAGADVELVPAGCAWINGYWSTTVATLLANLDTVEAHRVGHDPSTLPFYACGHHLAYA